MQVGATRKEDRKEGGSVKLFQGEKDFRNFTRGGDVWRGAVAGLKEEAAALAAAVEGAKAVTAHLALPQKGFGIADFMIETTLPGVVAAVHDSSSKAPPLRTRRCRWRLLCHGGAESSRQF